MSRTRSNPSLTPLPVAAAYPWDGEGRTTHDRSVVDGLTESVTIIRDMLDRWITAYNALWLEARGWQMRAEQAEAELAQAYVDRAKAIKPPTEYSYRRAGTEK